MLSESRIHGSVFGMLRPFCILFLGLFLPSFADPIPAKDRTVILISIDGFPAWMWKDPTLVIPNLRKLAAAGAQAEAMTVSNPSITWINHTTLVTGVMPGKHGVLYNGLLVPGGPGKPPAIEQWRDKADLVRVPTLYDQAFKAGLKTAQVDWVAILNSGTIHHEFLEIPKLGGAIEQEMIAAGLITADDVRNFTKGKSIVWRDAIWTQAAVHMIEKHRPNLLLFHLLTTDAVNHQYGPGTLASHTAYAYADRLVGDLLAALDRAGLREKATIAVATDHGFKKLTKGINMNVALRDAGYIRTKAKETEPATSAKVPLPVGESPAGTTKDKAALDADRIVESCDAYVMPQGGMAFVYITDPARKLELLPRLKTLCAGIEGVAEVVDGNDGPKLGMPTPATNTGMGDIVLFAKAGYAFRAGHNGAAVVDEPKNYLGTHGYPANDPELDGIFVISGYGIQKGVKIPRMANVDVAPTLAELLGVQIPAPDGRVLREVLAR